MKGYDRKERRALEKAITLQQAGRLAEASKAYAAVLKKNPKMHTAVYLSAIVAYQARDYKRAIPLMESACQRMPLFAAAHYNLGRFYQDTGRREEARDRFLESVRLDPALVEGHIELGNITMDLGQVEQALRHYDHAETLPAKTVEARYNRSFARMVRGDLAQGFADYESRWDLPLWSIEHGRPDLTQPVWDGSALDGRTLLVHVEQGFGDTLMMCRYWNHPKLRHATVVWEVQQRLERLLAGSCPAGHRVIPHGSEIPPHDVKVSMMSLPHKCGIATADEIPGTPYVFPLQGLHHVIPDMPDVRLRVGIRGAGNPEHRNDHRRSTKAEQWEPLLKLPGIQWVGLQAVEGQDWADTAALVAQCDLVISVDTAAAHLAGAMGKEVWILLPKTPEFRWGLNGETTPWYPTARLCRQTEAGNWTEVMERVAGALVRVTQRREAA